MRATKKKQGHWQEKKKIGICELHLASIVAGGRAGDTSVMVTSSGGKQTFVPLMSVQRFVKTDDPASVPCQRRMRFRTNCPSGVRWMGTLSMEVRTALVTAGTWTRKGRA